MAGDQSTDVCLCVETRAKVPTGATLSLSPPLPSHLRVHLLLRLRLPPTYRRPHRRGTVDGGRGVDAVVMGHLHAPSGGGHREKRRLRGRGRRAREARGPGGREGANLELCGFS